VQPPLKNFPLLSLTSQQHANGWNYTRSENDEPPSSSKAIETIKSKAARQRCVLSYQQQMGDRRYTSLRACWELLHASSISTRKSIFSIRDSSPLFDIVEGYVEGVMNKALWKGCIPPYKMTDRERKIFGHGEQLWQGLNLAHESKYGGDDKIKSTTYKKPTNLLATKAGSCR
jgi:hypothetical protein